MSRSNDEFRRRFARGAKFVLLAAIAWGCLHERSEARVRLENICTIYGQHEVKLTGIGLVVGLAGTGDGGRNLPAMRALQASLRNMNMPTLVEELKDAKNVAVVLVEATVPKSGLRRGQHIDCYVSAVFGAKSLRGGRLLSTPLETAEVKTNEMVGLASGALFLEDVEVPTAAKIPAGAALEKNFVTPFIDKQRGHVITLLLDAAHSSFHAASEVSRVVNSEYSFEANNQQLARAVGPGVVEVQVPASYRDAPVDFIAQVLEVGIDNPHTEARVVINSKTGTVVVTGEVEISPVVVSHKNLTVEVGGGGGDDPAPEPFVPVIDSQSLQASTQQLQQLVEALNQLRVPTADVIQIIRELHRSGKLHAAFDDH